MVIGSFDKFFYRATEDLQVLNLYNTTVHNPKGDISAKNHVIRSHR
jgi:hypothetical protein